MNEKLSKLKVELEKKSDENDDFQEFSKSSQKRTKNVKNQSLYSDFAK